MTAARRWGFAIAGLLIANVAAVSLLIGFAHGATESRVITDHEPRARDFWHIMRGRP
jgi:hypothetical protein